MRLDRVNAKRRDQTPHLLELIVLQGKTANFGSAHWSKVGGVGEENRPLALLPLEEAIEVAVRRFHFEVGNDVAKAQAAAV